MRRACACETVQQYREDQTVTLLATRDDNVLIGIAGYTVGDTEIALLHIATAPAARQSGVGRRLLDAVRSATPTTLSLIAETDTASVGFYIATGFSVISSIPNRMPCWIGRKVPWRGEIPRTPRAMPPVRRRRGRPRFARNKAGQLDSRSSRAGLRSLRAAL
ncbi:GNAT family N-acetyltransferase [Mycolicibacterium llatzerense]|uniref:GNAT family N-acetyltransferase n=1 Tax=Mycolicibacterium llatzerense TaxID=280871 RepID=UPI0009F3ECA3